jgi:peptide/nickel transport system substrate-binding protein
MCVQLDNRYGLSDITKNRSVRRAFYYAIDADSIIKNVFNGQAKRLQGQVLPEEYFGFNPDLKAPPYDPDQAKRLLAEGGYPGGFEETFMVPSGRYVQDKEVGQVIADQLAKVGIRTKLQFLEVGDFFNKALGGTLGPISYIGTLSAPHAAFALTVDSCAYEASYMCNQSYDQLIDQATRTLDKNEELNLYKQATQIAFDDPSRIFLWRTNDVYGVNNRVQNWKARSDQEVWFNGVSVKT